MHQVLCDRPIHEHILRHETSAAAVKASSRTAHEYGTWHTTETERLRIHRAQRISLRAVCRTHASSAVCTPREHKPHSQTLRVARSVLHGAALRDLVPVVARLAYPFLGVDKGQYPASTAFRTSSVTTCTGDVRLSLA